MSLLRKLLGFPPKVVPEPPQPKFPLGTVVHHFLHAGIEGIVYDYIVMNDGHYSQFWYKIRIVDDKGQLISLERPNGNCDWAESELVRA